MVRHAETPGFLAGVLAAVRRGSHHRLMRRGALGYIICLGAQGAQRNFLGKWKHRTLASFAECLKAVPDIDSCTVELLQALQLLECDQEDLRTSSLYNRLQVVCSADGDTGNLAKLVLQQQGATAGQSEVLLSSGSAQNVQLAPLSKPTPVKSDHDAGSHVPISSPVASHEAVPLLPVFPGRERLHSKSCEQPEDALKCAGCMRPIHCGCRTQCHLSSHASHQDASQSCIWCRVKCQAIQASTVRLVSNTLDLGATPSSLPNSFLTTYTSGYSERHDSQTDVILPAARSLLPEFKTDSRHESSGIVKLVEAFVECKHPDWIFRNTVTFTLWAHDNPGQDAIQLKECLPLATIIFRIQGKDLVDLLYAGTHTDLRGCRIMQVAMLALQMELTQMGVERIFLDAADRKAKDFWTLPPVGFSVIQETDWQRLLKQYSLFKNDSVEARCIKLMLTHTALVEQLSKTLSKVPQNLFDLKKMNMEERLRQADAQQQQPHSKHGEDALQQFPGNKRRVRRTSNSRPIATPAAMTEFVHPASPQKRPRVMTGRFSDSDVQLNSLRKSLSNGEAFA